jgi:hypothetical protein
MNTTFLLFTILLAATMNVQSQDLSTHQWKDRLILILTDDTDSSVYQDQIEELYSNPKGLNDRKLVIYTVLPDKFKSDDMPNQGWVQSNELHKDYKKSDRPFEILLIGLDGGVKLRQSEFLSNEDLFGRIDQMPMRRNELRRRGEDN